MKKSSLIPSLAIASFAMFGTVSARASQVPQYNPLDLLLGFYDFSGTVTNDYLVDLGPIANFNFNQNFVILSSTSKMGTDLTAIFPTVSGTTWFTSGHIYFGLAAATTANFQVYATDPLGNDPWTREAVQSQPEGAVFNMGNQGYSLATQTIEQDPRGLEQADSATDSWDDLAGTFNGTGGLNGFYNGANGDQYISDVVTNDLPFDQINQGSGPSTDLGFFSLDSAGDLSFTSAAVPEPSTYAAIGVGAVILLTFRRRRRRI